jgi:hypothetical protein
MNKKEKEAFKRAEHKKRLQAAKARRRSGSSLERAEPQKIEKPKILIVCEGKNTEPSYFSQFKLSNAEVFPVGEGKNTITLVESVKKIIDNSDHEFDQVWCVFDKDDFPNQNFDNAIAKAASLGYNTAYSNQAFEYWFILHFEGHNGGAMHRDDYCKKLNDHLEKYNVTYNCDSKNVSPDFFEIMISLTGKVIDDKPQTLQDLAIERAIKIEGYHKGETPSNSESLTLVYGLIQELNKFK